MAADPATPHPPRAVGAGPGRPRWLLAAAIAAALLAYLALDPGTFAAWEALLRQRARWQRAARARPIEAAAVFVAAYIATAALSLPGAGLMSLLGGALFGRWVGTAIVSLASTAGAAAAFLATRHLLRDVVAARWRGRLEPINRGVDASGASYLLTLRLVPAFPFVLINAAMGLTSMRLSTFWWASQLGMLPATFLYVNAGAELGRVASPGEVLSPGVLLPLSLLGLVPLLVGLVIRARRRRATPDVACRGGPD